MRQDITVFNLHLRVVVGAADAIPFVVVVVFQIVFSQPKREKSNLLLLISSFLSICSIYEATTTTLLLLSNIITKQERAIKLSNNAFNRIIIVGPENINNRNKIKSE